MTPSTIETLYAEFRATYVSTPDFVINFYEKNAMFFNNIKQFLNKEELGMYIEIVEKYIWAFYNKGSYNIAIDLVDKHQVFIDKEIKRLNADELKNEWYYSLSFVKGMASYNQNDYKTATRIFKRLVLIDNKNDNYKNWLKSSKYYLQSKFIHIFQIVCFIVVIIVIFFPKYISRNIGIPLNEIAMVGFLVTFLYEYYVRYSRRSKRKPIN
jgi:tetratricopeptide (TPR) repeat protein